MTFLKHTVLFLFVFLLPTQFGKHFFLNFSYVDGVRVDYLSLVLYATDLLAIVLIVLFWRKIRKDLYKNKHFLVFLGLLTVTNILSSQYPLLAGYTALKFLEIYLVFLIFRNIKITKQAILTPLFLGGLVELTLSTAQFYYKHSLQGAFYYLGERFFTLSTSGIATASFFDREILRPYGTFSHPNSMGGFYLLMYAFALSLKDKSYIKQGVILVSSLLIFLSFSKVVIIIYVFITALSLVPQLFKKKCLPCLIGRMTVIFFVSAMFLQAHADPLSLEKRVRLIQESIIIFKQNILLGTGFGHHLFAHAQFPNPYPHFFLQPVHNIFVLFIMQAGLVISAFVAIPIIKYARNLRKNKLYAVLLVIILTGFVDHYWLTLQQNMLLLGVVFGIIKNSKIFSER